ncbi:MAG: HAMP domain-containing histidine kinase [Lachnospiraceae bacterium]|nr:HAMP domain-containing histidine kinase [Lachnospiraceae bacterium]
MIYCLVAAVIIIAVLSVRIYLLKKSAREIADQFADRLSTDTNALIDISSRDRDMMHMADSVNKQLKVLRREHLMYELGNSELKTAITNVSHDIRTPLTAIYGYLELLEKTDDPEKRARYISIMKERAGAMKQLTEELFKYTVIVADEGEIALQDVNISQVLEDSIMGYYGALTQSGIAVDVKLCEENVVRKLNREYLERVFSNLLNNALKYSDGDLLIKLSEDGEIIFSNTAKGLSAVEVEQLFDRFYTVEAAHHSTGLGLSIARTLITRMGGSISASLEGDMLTIRITFN